MIPNYVKELYHTLLEEYSVKYYQDRLGDDLIEDCFVLNGFCIKIDRLPIEDLSKEDMNILLNSIRDMYILLQEKWKEWGNA